jgi:electron transfer flavoprotein alpha subunit
METALANTQPAAILAGHTALGADLAPRLAFRLKVGIATACERVTIGDGTVRATRPCYGNKAREVLALAASPAIVTVRARMYEPLTPDAARRGEVVELAAPSGAAPATRVIERRQEDAGTSARLESANVIVAGGRGLGGPEGFAVLEHLASVLGGAVGASRVACDLGWCPPSWQIGLTGKTVTPDLYIAVGISGASHHMAGCGNSKTILAINSDPEAAIFREARFGVVGDYREIVPALAEAIAKRADAS